MTIFHHFPIVFVCVCSMKQPRTTNRHPRHRLERGGHNSAPEAHELPADDGSQGDDVPGVPQKGSMGSAHPKLVGGFNHLNFIFHFIYGMSSLPLTNSIIFQDGYCTTNQQDCLSCPALGSLGCPDLLAFSVWAPGRGVEWQQRWEL